MGSAKQKGIFEQAQNAQNTDLSRACAKSHPGICSPAIHSVVSSESVGGQRIPRSDCADAQADLGLRSPHLLEDIFSHF